MKVGTIEQQPEERKSYSVVYTDDLADGDKVESATATVSPGGLLVDDVGVFDEGQRVKLWIEGGVHGGSYKITIDAVTKNGERLQDELAVKIKEI